MHSRREIRTRLEQAITTRQTTYTQPGCIHRPTGTCTSIAGAAKSLGPVHEGPTTPWAPRRVRPRSLGEQYANRHAQARRAHPRAEALTNTSSFPKHAEEPGPISIQQCRVERADIGAGADKEQHHNEQALEVEDGRHGDKRGAKRKGNKGVGGRARGAPHAAEGGEA